MAAAPTAGIPRDVEAHAAGRSAFVAIALLAMLPALPARAQNATVQAPARVTVGQPFELRWTDPSAEREFISVDRADAPESSYGPYVYANAEQPATLRAPDEPSRYWIRYHRGSTGYAVIASHAIEVADTTASFDAIPPVAAGAPVTIAWRGPAFERDFISIDPDGAPDRDHGVYAYTAAGNPVTLRLPDVPGRYAIRYHMGQSWAVIGSAPITVLPNTATVRSGVRDGRHGVSRGVERPGQRRRLRQDRAGRRGRARLPRLGTFHGRSGT